LKWFKYTEAKTTCCAAEKKRATETLRGTSWIVIELIVWGLNDGMAISHQYNDYTTESIPLRLEKRNFAGGGAGCPSSGVITD
jgi:hypothetical protein